MFTSGVIQGPEPLVTKCCFPTLICDTHTTNFLIMLYCFFLLDVIRCKTFLNEHATLQYLHIIMSKCTPFPKEALAKYGYPLGSLCSNQSFTPAAMGIHCFPIAIWDSLFLLTQAPKQVNVFSFSSPVIIFTNLKWTYSINVLMGTELQLVNHKYF